jgi:hypothetical protein
MGIHISLQTSISKVSAHAKGQGLENCRDYY